eukprot:4426741-Pyramimonas_sp.AAC.1
MRDARSPSRPREAPLEKGSALAYTGARGAIMFAPRGRPGILCSSVPTSGVKHDNKQIMASEHR